MRNKKTVGDWVLEIFSLLCAVLFIVPVIWAIAVSFKAEGTPINMISDWFLPPYTLENYPEILFETAVPTWFANSLFNAVVSMGLVLLVSAMAAFAIARIPFKGKSAFYFYFLLGMMVPGEATIIPLFITVNDFNLIDSYAGMILPGLAGSMNMIIMVTFFKGIPNELFEAARIDGAGNVSIFVRILLPLCKTVLVTIGIFSFLGSWNNYLWPLLCAMSESMFTLPIGLPSFVAAYSIDYVKPLTANMVASIPAIILFLIFEKQIVRGVAMSGIKG